MKTFKVIMLGIAGLLLWNSYFRDFSDSRHSLEESVLRLHILANSDSFEDQELKLRIRDRLLEETDLLFSGADIDEAISLARKNLTRLDELAEEIAGEYGHDVEVDCTLGEVTFDERVYEDYVLPAGEYMALQVKIGEAKGQNWWCVMYPPLCLPGAVEDASEFFTEDELELMYESEKYEIRFKIVEIAQDFAELAECIIEG